MAACPHSSKWRKPNTSIILAEKWRSTGFKGWNGRATSLQHYGERCAATLSTDNKPFAVPSHTRTTFITAFSYDSSLLASCHGDHRIHIFDVQSRKLFKSLEGHVRSPWCVTFHCSTNDILASGSLNGEVRVWDIRRGGYETCYLYSDQVSTCPITSMSFHPYGRLLAIAVFNEIHFWDWSSPAPFTVIKTGTDAERVRLVRFDALGQYILTGICNADDPSEDEEEEIEHVSPPVYQNHGVHCSCRICTSNRRVHTGTATTGRTTDSALRLTQLRWNRRSTRSRTANSTTTLLSELSARTSRLRNHICQTFPSSESTTSPSVNSVLASQRRTLTLPESSESDSETEARARPLPLPDPPSNVPATEVTNVESTGNTAMHELNFRIRRNMESTISYSRDHERILNAQVSVNEEIQHQYNRLQYLRNERRRLELRLQDLQNRASVTNRVTADLNETPVISARFLFPQSRHRSRLSGTSSTRPLSYSSSTTSFPVPPSSSPEATTTSGLLPWSQDPLITNLNQSSPTSNTSRQAEMLRHFRFQSELLRRRLRDTLYNSESISRPEEPDVVAVPLPYVEMSVDGLSFAPIATTNTPSVVISPPEALTPPVITRTRSRSRRRRFTSRANSNSAYSAFAFYRAQQAVAAGIDNATSYRLQWWDFARCDLPKIDRSDLNVVSSSCKIYNDASVDISHDRRIVAAFVVENHEILQDSTFVGVFSLQKKNFGDLLYRKKYGPDAVCLSISPLDRYVAVGVKSRHFCIRYQGARNLMAHIIKLGKTDSGEMEVVSQISHPTNSLPRRLVSINTISWIPYAGGGLIYGTNTGELRACYPERKLDVIFDDDSEAPTSYPFI